MQGKIAIAFLAVLAVAAASSSSNNYGWEQGKEYTYKTKLRLLTGIPSLKNQYSGIQARLQLKVQVKDATTLAVKPSDVQIGHMHGAVAEGWTSDDIDFKPLQEAQTRDLEQPFFLKMKKGQVKSIVVNGQLPQEIVNFQKALVNALQLDLQERNSIESSRARNALEQAITSSSKGQDRTIYSTMEETVNGECETLYDISQLPRHMVKEDPRMIPTPEACHGDKFFEVVQTTNFSNCEKRPVFNFAAPLGMQCPPGVARCGDYWNRAAETVYVLCGEDRENYAIQRIMSKEVIVVDPFGYSTEELQGGAQLNMTLQQVKSISSPIHAPENAVKVKDLTYDFPQQNKDRSQQRHHNQQDSDDDSEEYDSQERSSSRNPKLRGVSRMNSKMNSRRQQWRSRSEEDSREDRRDQQQNRQQHSSQESRRQSHERREKRSSQQGKRHHGSHEKSSSRTPSWASHSSAFAKDNLPPAYWQVNASSHLPQPSLTKAYYLPLLTFGVNGPSVISQSEAQSKAVEAIREIASDLIEVPQDLAQKELPSQVEKVGRFLAMLDLDQLKQVHDKVAAEAQEQQKQPQSSSDKKKSAQRSIFWDATAMAGSNPSVMLIKQKVLSKQLQGEEAVQAVATIPKYAQTPTKELVEEMFDLVKKTETSSKGMTQLESTTLLAFSNLIHHAFIRPQAQHTKYATSLFGAFGSPKTKEIASKYVPYIANRLRSAENNYEQAVLITALGLIGHESILPVLRPYVQGEVDTSNDARAKAIFALRHLALEDSYYRTHKPEVSMEVIKTYATILSSPAEQYEARIVALGNLILANPPFVYFQRAALRTWYEQDNQVASAIYSTLSSLASSNDPFHYHMAKKASQALQLAKPVQQGLPYSTNWMSGDIVKNWNLAYSSHIMSIGSRSGLMPNKAYARTYLQYGDFSFNPFEASVNASAASQLIAEAIENLGANDDDDSSSYPALNKIRRALNIQKRSQGPAEGSAYIKILGEVTRMLPIDETLLKTFKRAALEAQQMIGQEQHFSIQKAFKAAEVIVSVPTIAGIPLVATFRYPVVASIQGKAQVDVQGMSRSQAELPTSVKAKAEIKAVFIAQKIASISFMEPTSKVIFSAGVEKQTFLQAPLRVEALVDLKAMRAELALRPHSDNKNDQEVELLQFHVRPYTAVRKQITPTPTSQAKSAEVKNIHLTRQPEKTDIKFGQKAFGLNFRVQQKMECCRGDFAAWYRKARHFSPATALQFFDESNTLAARQTRITFNAAQSETDQVTASIHIGTASKSADDKVDVSFRAAQKSLQDDEQSSKQDVEQGKEKMKQALSQAKAGYAVTVAAELELSSEQSKQEARRYAAAVTVAKGTFGLNEKLSLHLERPQIPGYDSQPWELCAEARSKFPALPAYSFSDMLQARVEAQAKVQVSFGKQCQKEKPQIEIQVDMERSEGQKQNVESSAEAKQCQHDEKQGQQLSPACRNATIQAATLNEYDIKIQYDQVPSALKNASYQLEDLATAALYPYMSQDRLNVQNKQGQIKIHAHVHQSNEEDDYLNVRVEKPSANIQFNAIPWSAAAETMFPINARQSVASRMQDQILGGNGQSECTIDGQQITTFDNSSYEAEFNTDNYHLLTKDCSKSGYKFAVLVKDDASKREQKKVKIILGNTEIKIEPTEGSSRPPSVQVNGEKQEVSINQWIEVEDKESGEVEARIAATKDGYVQVEAPQQRIQVTSDGERIIIESAFTHQGDLCGLCGTFDGEQSGDLQTPDQCVESQDDVEDFVQSYEVDESGKKQQRSRRSSQESSSQEQKRRSDRKHHSQSRSSAVQGCANKKDKTMSDLMSALQGQSSRGGHHSSRSSHSGRSSSSCTTRKHKVVARQGEKCFSLRPVDECKPGCRPTNMVPQQVAFHCVPEGSLAEHLEAKAESSQLPEMSGKSADLTRSVFTPKSCTSSF